MLLIHGIPPRRSLPYKALFGCIAYEYVQTSNCSCVCTRDGQYLFMKRDKMSKANYNFNWIIPISVYTCVFSSPYEISHRDFLFAASVFALRIYSNDE